MGFTNAYAESISVSASQILSRDNKLVFATGGTDGIVITLYPAQNGDTLAVTVVKVDSGAGAVQVIGQNISVNLTAQFQSTSAQFTGAGWQEFANTGAGGGGGGTPGSPALSVQGASGDGTTFVGISGSNFDATTGVITLTPSGGDNGLAIVADACRLSGLDVSRFNGGSGISTDIENTNATDDDVVAIDAQVYESDDSGSGVRIVAVSGFAELEPTNNGSNITGDTAYGAVLKAFGSADGNPAELTDLLCSGNGTKATFTAGIASGVRITDKNANNSPATVNAALLIEDQTPGSTVFSIKTGAGPVEFGDTVNAAGYKANGVAGISGNGSALTAVTVTNGLITAATFTP